MNPWPLIYFRRRELECRCGCGLLPQMHFCYTLDQMRHDFGEPIIVTSGARCEQWNFIQGGADDSTHKEGIGADLLRRQSLLDFLVSSLDKYDIYLENPEYTVNWLHIDKRERSTRIFNPSV